MRMFALIAATLALLAAMPASADPVSPAAAVGAPMPAEAIPLVFDDPVFSGAEDSGFVILRDGGFFIARNSVVRLFHQFCAPCTNLHHK